MRISDKALDEFIEIYRDEFAEEINRAEATEMAHRVLAFYRLLRRKLPNGYPEAQCPTPHVEGDHAIGFRI
jgi:hypothetical protein